MRLLSDGHLGPPIAVVAIGVAVLLGSCASDENPSAARPESAVVSPSMAAGKKLYYGRCASCHTPEPVGYYTRAEWASMVGHMRKRAKLTPEEEASLLAFLHANAADA